jgi:hypothetical protein
MGGLAEILTWVGTNIVKSLVFIPVGLILYAAVLFVNAWIPGYVGTMTSQHADLSRAIESYAKLDTILETMRTKYHASRAALYRFHDSSKDASQMAFYFVSVASIVGESTDAPGLKDINAATFRPVLDVIVKRNIWFHVRRDVPQGPFKDLIVKRGDQAALFVMMPDLDGHPIGMLSLEWLSAPDIPAMTDLMKGELTGSATLLSGYFSLAPIRDPSS